MNYTPLPVLLFICLLMSITFAYIIIVFKKVGDFNKKNMQKIKNIVEPIMIKAAEMNIDNGMKLEHHLQNKLDEQKAVIIKCMRSQVKEAIKNGESLSIKEIIFMVEGL